MYILCLPFHFYNFSFSGYLTTQSHFKYKFCWEKQPFVSDFIMEIVKHIFTSIAQTTFYTDVWCVCARGDFMSLSSSSLPICLMQCMHLSFGSVMRHKSANALCSLLVVALNFMYMFVCMSMRSGFTFSFSLLHLHLFTNAL